MENTTETSEASAEQSGADTTINANLSVDDLAASFVEKVEAQTEEPQSTTEATEDVTETEVVDAEEDQEGTVLSQSQSDDEDSDEEAEIDEAQPKGLTKALKQINRLTARAKGAEEEVATLKAQVESLKTPTNPGNSSRVRTSFGKCTNGKGSGSFTKGSSSCQRNGHCKILAKTMSRWMVKSTMTRQFGIS